MSKKVLIIEDEPSVRENVAVLLGFEGYETLTAKNGSEGIKTALLEMPDLILCDVAMPAITGHDVLKFLKGNKSTANIPLIFMTAKADLKDIRTGMELGADDYLTKPFTREELLRSVTMRMRKRETEEQKLQQLQSSIRENFPHELRSPVLGILRYGELLKSQAGELTPQELNRIGTEIVSQAENVNRIVDQFLWMMHLDLIQSDPVYLATEKNEAITDPSTMVRESARKTAEKYERESDLIVASYIEVEMKISAEMFGKVVYETVDNAFRYSEKGDKVTVATSVAGGFFQISVKNVSRGSDSDHIFKIGEFLRYGGKDEKKPGIGFGLSIVKKITELVEGKIATSMAGEQFFLELSFPVIDPEAN